MRPQDDPSKLIHRRLEVDSLIPLSGGVKTLNQEAKSKGVSKLASQTSVTG